MTGTDSCPTAAQVLVVGSGIAGLTAALRASRTAEVLLVTKGALADGATACAQGGIAGAVGAVGGFLVPRGFAMSTTGFGSLVPAIGVFIAAYVLMATLTWAVYVRRGARLAGEGI